MTSGLGIPRSLAYIDKHPFSKIKVDRSFVSGSGASLTSKAIVRAVAKMGKQLGMAIVAEGLETVDQVDDMRASGCTLGQGYYFSRAEPDYPKSSIKSPFCKCEPIAEIVFVTRCLPVEFPFLRA